MKILGNSRGAAAIVAVAFGLAAVPAWAQTAPGAAAAPAVAAKPADPKALFASGEKKFKANDFAGALSDFEASETAKASPETERYIALCHDNLGHSAEAVAAFEKFLANVPASMKAQGDEAKKRVDAIKATPGKVHVESNPPGAAISIDGQPSGPNPTPTDIDLPAGKHTLKLTAPGYDATDKDVDVAYASKQDVRVELTKPEAPAAAPIVEAPAPPPPAPPPAPPPEPRSKVPAYVTGAVAIVATGVGIGFGLKALSQSNDFKTDPTTQRADDGENNALVADMMFGIAITFGVTSAVLFLSSDAPASSTKATSPTQTAATPKPKKNVTVTAAPYMTRGGGGAGALVSF